MVEAAGIGATGTTKFIAQYNSDIASDGKYDCGIAVLSSEFDRHAPRCEETSVSPR